MDKDLSSVLADIMAGRIVVLKMLFSKNRGRLPTNILPEDRQALLAFAFLDFQARLASFLHFRHLLFSSFRIFEAIVPRIE